ncbi:hypothetical protein FB567DRAFT_588342 [Paraphoma chrysanthemicola]|uniref:Uncharacterized protein n=1 Tax=Paraphoma chrysanthemicola TaxID=798071 RepID=A0A8K0W2I0_9PLEO|nr:hypothetical protein FB567DRAFT_588342 [Paraphoma chrysanthemicola]
MSEVTSLDMTVRTTHEPINIECTDGSFIIWATLALARLNKLAPSEENEALTVPSFVYRECVDAVRRAFAAEESCDIWSSTCVERRNEMLARLKEKALAYYQSSAESTGHVPGYDANADLDEFSYAFSIFVAFHKKLLENPPTSTDDTYGAHGMKNAVYLLIRQHLQPTLNELFTALNDLKNEHPPDLDRCIYGLIWTYFNSIYKRIDEFLRDQARLIAHGNYDPDNRFGYKLASFAYSAVHDCIYFAVEDLVVALDVPNDSLIDLDSPATESHTEKFLLELASLFTYESELVSYDGYDEEDDDDDMLLRDMPTHIVTHDFSQYTDDDWFAREYELVNNLQDVLRGPEKVSVEELWDLRRV